MCARYGLWQAGLWLSQICSLFPPRSCFGGVPPRMARRKFPKKHPQACSSQSCRFSLTTALSCRLKSVSDRGGAKTPNVFGPSTLMSVLALPGPSCSLLNSRPIVLAAPLSFPNQRLGSLRSPFLPHFINLLCHWFSSVLSLKSSSV